MHYDIEIPKALSLLAYDHPNAEVRGLDQVPAANQPPVNVVHIAFDLMVFSGFALLGLALWLALAWRRHHDLPDGRWFLRAVVASGVVAVVALEAGWTTTEVGRQPWIVYGYMRTAEAVNPASGLMWGFVLVSVTYALLTVATVATLRWLRHQNGVEVVVPQGSRFAERDWT
jgi:cytochrome d ubiquinol oxidase subunit I